MAQLVALELVGWRATHGSLRLSDTIGSGVSALSRISELAQLIFLAALFSSSPSFVTAECCQSIKFEEADLPLSSSNTGCGLTQYPRISGVQEFSEFSFYLLSNGRYAVVHSSMGCIFNLNLGENLLLSSDVDTRSDEWIIKIFEDGANPRAILEVGRTSMTVRAVKGE